MSTQETKPVRGIIIDPYSKSVSDTRLIPSLEEMQRAVGGYIEHLLYIDDRHVLVGDEEGLLKRGLPGFHFAGGMFFVGPVLILRLRGEDYSDAKLPLAVVRDAVEWPS